jgi:hypothetical protein
VGRSSWSQVSCAIRIFWYAFLQTVFGLAVGFGGAAVVGEYSDCGAELGRLVAVGFGAVVDRDVVLAVDLALGVKRLELVDLRFHFFGNFVVVAVIVMSPDYVVILLARRGVGLGLAVGVCLEVGQGFRHGGLAGAVEGPALGGGEAGALWGGDVVVVVIVAGVIVAARRDLRDLTRVPDSEMDARCAAAGWEDMKRKAVPMAATLEIPQMLQLQEGMMNGLSVVGVEACARGGEWGEEAARLSTSQKPRPFGNARHRYFALSRALTPNSWSIQ